MKGTHRAPRRREHEIEPEEISSTGPPRVALGVLMALTIIFAALFIVAFLVALDPGTSCQRIGDWKPSELGDFITALWRNLL